MNNNGNFSRAVSAINSGNFFTICLPSNYTVDTVASATTLYLALNKLGKNVTLACDQEISLEANLIGADKIQKQLTINGDTLVISFPYIEGAVDKVTYNIEGEYFNLVIQPRPGQPKLDPSKVKYSYTGGKIDVIITIDAPTLNSLGNLYLKNENQFRGKEIINIDRHLTNSSFGTVNLIDRQSSSTSEIVFKLLQYLQVEIDRDMATNLYAGVVSATNNFSAYSVNAQTFEVSAQLLKFGAVRKQISRTRVHNFSSPSFSSSQFFPSKLSSNFTQPSFEKPLSPSEKTIEKKEKKVEEITPKDWLKPKIFHGNNII